MSTDKETREKIKQYFTSKKFIAMALVCALAIGTGVFTSVSVKRTLEESLSGYEESTAAQTKPQMTENAANDVTGVTVKVTEKTAEEEISVEKKEDFVFPVSKKIVKDYSNFTAVKSNTMNDWRVHNGVDFQAEVGDEVKAMQSGAVLAIYHSTLWGTVIEIDHGAGIIARYCGLNEKCSVTASDVVQAGDTIGIIAEIPIEAADGTHLHLEITRDGAFSDPLELFE